MRFKWSRNAPQILSLFRPWCPGDGYDEATIRSAETSLGIQLPATLRLFYQSWGARDDLTRVREAFLAPHEIFLHSDAMIFCVENQAVLYWSIRRESVGKANPPVYVAYNQGSDLSWSMSHDHLSDFLDALTYAHAFAGGAVHGGVSVERIDEHRTALLAKNWQRITVNSLPWGLMPQEGLRLSSFFIRQGQAIDPVLEYWAATQSEEDLDQIAHTLAITWKTRW